jgi:DnaK suppressor protein
MARRDALLRLHKTLLARRDQLFKRLGGELTGLHNKIAASGDSADLAFDSGREEVSSQLAELEARELNQVQRALDRLRQGSYGVCEGCSKKIPVARLNALPFTTTCIQCQREMETYGGWDRDGGSANWDKVSEAHVPFEDQREIRMSDLEMDISSR